MVDLLFKQTKASHELLESLVECEKQSSGKGKGPSLKLGNQPVPVKVTLARIRALTALYAIAEDSSFAANIDSLGLPSKIRSVNNWTCNWTEKEDKQLLKSKFLGENLSHSFIDLEVKSGNLLHCHTNHFILGVLKYGVGTWEEAKADLELELNSKILPTSDDATPQVNSFSIRKPAF